MHPSVRMLRIIQTIGLNFPTAAATSPLRWRYHHTTPAGRPPL